MVGPSRSNGCIILVRSIGKLYYFCNRFEEQRSRSLGPTYLGTSAGYRRPLKQHIHTSKFLACCSQTAHPSKPRGSRRLERTLDAFVGKAPNAKLHNFSCLHLQEETKFGDRNQRNKRVRTGCEFMGYPKTTLSMIVTVF